MNDIDQWGGIIMMRAVFSLRVFIIILSLLLLDGLARICIIIIFLLSMIMTHLPRGMHVLELGCKLNPYPIEKVNF